MDQILLYVFRRESEATGFIGFNKKDTLEIRAKWVLWVHHIEKIEKSWPMDPTS